MGPLSTFISITIVLAVALAASEALALFHPDERINSLLQWVRARGVVGAMSVFVVGVTATWMLAAGVAEGRSTQSIASARAQWPNGPCPVHDLANRSFVGAWRGRTSILHIITSEVTSDSVVFEYDLMRGGESIRGKGSIRRATCEVALSSFDSAGGLVGGHGRLVLKSVEAAWAPTSGARGGAA